MYRGGAYFEYKEVFDRTSTVQEVCSLLETLDSADAIKLLCQINLDLRLVKRDREAAGKLQQEIAGGFLDDETVSRFQARFGPVHMGDRPVFHTPQILNAINLVARHSSGTDKPSTSDAA